jgi:hypothetical protein
MTSVLAATPTAAPILLDLDASPIAGQTGWAVLDLNGNVLKNNALSLHDAQILFQMLQESTSVAVDVDNKGRLMTRLTVTFPGVARFLVTRDDTHIYLVQTRVVE